MVTVTKVKANQKKARRVKTLNLKREAIKDWAVARKRKSRVVAAFQVA
jgi:hypothetical protein